MAGNTQAVKNASEDRNETRREYLSVHKDLKTLLSGLRPTGHPQLYLQMPLCGP